MTPQKLTCKFVCEVHPSYKHKRRKSCKSVKITYKNGRVVNIERLQNMTDKSYWLMMSILIGVLGILCVLLANSITLSITQPTALSHATLVPDGYLCGTVNQSTGLKSYNSTIVPFRDECPNQNFTLWVIYGDNCMGGYLCANMVGYT